MALINKTDFSIYSFDTREANQEDYFECDDLIAPAISLLNRKGYTTKWCCSGHAYGGIQEAIVYDKMPDLCDIQSETGFTIIEVSENIPDKLEPIDEDIPDKYYVVEKCDWISGFYVAFDKKYDFPELPEGAYIDDQYDCIRWDINELTTYDFKNLDKIYEFNKSFYEWVTKLENIKGE